MVAWRRFGLTDLGGVRKFFGRGAVVGVGAEGGKGKGLGKGESEKKGDLGAGGDGGGGERDWNGYDVGDKVERVDEGGMESAEVTPLSNGKYDCFMWEVELILRISSADCRILKFLGHAKEEPGKLNSEITAKPSSKRTKSAAKEEDKKEADEVDEEEPVRKRLRRGWPEKKPSPVVDSAAVDQALSVDLNGSSNKITSDLPQKASKAESTDLASRTREKGPQVADRLGSPTAALQQREMKNNDESGEHGKAMNTASADVLMEGCQEEGQLQAKGEEEESEEEKPEIAAKAREKVQSTLKSNTKDPYPDWKLGEPAPYAALCTTFSLIELTTKRLIISAHCSLFLRQVLRLTPNDLLPTVQLMINKLAADYAGVEIGIGESLIMKAIGESTGRSLATIKADQKDIGDLGLVAAKSRSNQPTMFKPKALTIRGVLDGLMGIATAQGHGAQQRKVDGIKKLLSAADASLSSKGGSGIDITKDKGGASEAKFIIRFLEGKLRLGLAEKTVLVALAHAMVIHETQKEGRKLPSSEQLAKGEAILKTVYR